MHNRAKAKKYSVLIVEDDALARATLIGMLCKEFDCSYVDDGLEAIRYCQKHETPNVILMDYHMPEVNGVDACIKLRECSRSKDIPIIFFTADEDCELQKQCWTAGASDFVAKPVKADVLKMRILHQISVKAKERHLESLACKDQLTSLPNRQFLMQSAPRLIKQLNREKASLSVLMVDVDNFKKYNDTYGHLDGDKVLKAVAGALSQCARRPLDCVMRFGGEEFLILLPKTSLEDAEFIGHRMTQAVEDLLITNKHANHGVVTVSIGLASTKQKGAIKFVDLIKQADKALYHAKATGKNRVSTGATARVTPVKKATLQPVSPLVAYSFG
ncbi:diguanylate cyclase response regulator [Alteromonas sp. KC3]|uniref:GGDEF domain-containing response regulator n=1 Tax=unclassified Alteromonas TaxID=2614992 RepID=UPI001924613B|nr:MULTISPECIES: diguanylate cyclase [unclassified Alteromonas]BCO20252.1 diguanylate cyclase response regulator [Alteromonas sp. KC3]BCO24218.1 diguanylate cyclase response regulator [Alteromonas sp. KC14]